MKKRKIKHLQLHKESISNLEIIKLKGGKNTNDIELCGTDINSCYWLVCPFSQGEFADCISGER